MDPYAKGFFCAVTDIQNNLDEYLREKSVESRIGSIIKTYGIITKDEPKEVRFAYDTLIRVKNNIPFHEIDLKEWLPNNIKNISRRLSEQDLVVKLQQ